MQDQVLVNLLSFYGFFLIVSGVVSVVFIGSKAKTALLSGGISGMLSLLIAFAMLHEIPAAPIAGIFLSLALLVVFSWRSTKTLFSIFDMMATAHTQVKEKGIAFLIISLMAVVSVFVFALQIALL